MKANFNIFIINKMRVYFLLQLIIIMDYNKYKWIMRPFYPEPQWRVFVYNSYKLNFELNIPRYKLHDTITEKDMCYWGWSFILHFV